MIAAKVLALNRKLRIYIIFGKEDNLLRYKQIFEFFFSLKFPLHLIFIPEFPEFSVEWLLFGHWTTAVKTSEDKGFNESYNGSARVLNICTFRSQLM